MKPTTIICFLLFIAGVAAVLIQTWFQPWQAEILLKILITDAGLFVIVFVMGFLIKEHNESKKIGGDDL